MTNSELSVIDELRYVYFYTLGSRNVLPKRPKRTDWMYSSNRAVVLRSCNRILKSIQQQSYVARPVIELSLQDCFPDVMDLLRATVFVL